MLEGPKELRPYTLPSGRMPFMEWLRGLRDRKARSVLRNRLERFSEGNPGYWRPIGQGVSELKINWGPGYRIYFGCDGFSLIILLIGGDKSTQQRDIDEAKTYWEDYQRRIRGTEC